MIKSFGIDHATMKKVRPRGFTLIEMSIVLVIIGLIVGGVLMGQDLVRAAGVRATISQIEKFNTAANTFYVKYGYLPGDIKDPIASNFGFAARGLYAGQGDGNGIIEGNWGGTPGAGDNLGWYEDQGETIQFWVDLSTAHLIEGGFNQVTIINNVTPNITSSQLSTFFPPAKLGKGNYVYVYSQNQQNYYGLAAITSIGASGNGQIASTTNLSAAEAYSIDVKADDGLSQSGNITAQFVQGSGVIWAAANGTAGASPGQSASSTTATCYDNGGNSSNAMRYSLETSNGNNLNCALSFRFQ